MTKGRISMHEMLRLAVLAAWAGTLVWLLAGHWWTGGAPPYQLFLHRQLWPLIALGLLVLVLFLTAVVVRAGQGGDSHGLRPGSLRAALLLLPLAYLAVAPSGGHGSYAFGKRYVGGGIVQRSGGVRPIRREADRPAGHYTLLELLYDFEALAGTRVVVEGQVFRDAQWSADRLMLFRFVIQCCAADAQPIGALVIHPEAGAVPVDAWVRVAGTLRAGTLDGSEQVVIEAESLERIEAPANRYLYPY
jgi:uncharacterized repeat protein (TIGR03943 family)